MFEEGQIFAVEGPFPSKTEGFCNWAWTDIHKTVALTMMGANPTLRPVTFRIQRIEA